jgi:hypothetical protein
VPRVTRRSSSAAFGCALLFGAVSLIPRTSILGAILLTGFFDGADAWTC